MKLHNITLNYTEQAHLTEISGDSEYTVDVGTLQAVFDYWESEGTESFVVDELREVLEQPQPRVTFTLADLFICICETLINHFEYDEFEIDCSYSHVIWLFHDLHHVRHDATLGEINVEQYTEQQAIRSSIDCCAKNNIAIPMDIIHTTESEYLERFKMSGEFVEYCNQYSTTLPSKIDLSIYC